MKNDDHHEENALPPEIEELYHSGQITIHDVNPLVEFREELIRSVPQPEDDFKERLGELLFTTTKMHWRSKRNRSIRQPSLRLILTLVGMFLVSIVVLAVSGILQQFINQDAGLNTVFRSGEGVVLDQRKTIDQYTVNLEWAYADTNRLSVGFSMPDFICPVTYTFCDVSVTVINQAGVEVNQLDSSSDVGQTERVYLYNFALSDLAPDMLFYTFQLHIIPFGVTNIDTPDSSGIVQTQREDINDPIEFIINVPISADVRLLTEPQNATDHGITITLQRVIVSSSQTRIAVCYIPPATERVWMAIPNLTTTGAVVSGGGTAVTVSGIGESRREVCNEFTYNTAMLDYMGEWQLEITDLVGMGDSGTDQQRVVGSWIFKFVIP